MIYNHKDTKIFYDYQLFKKLFLIPNSRINGKVFDSSRGGAPLACRLRDLIEGWIVALQEMHIGDKWEVYIPAEMGYGRFSQPGIPSGSTLIFEIELIGIA